MEDGLCDVTESIMLMCSHVLTLCSFHHPSLYIYIYIFDIYCCRCSCSTRYSFRQISGALAVPAILIEHTQILHRCYCSARYSYRQISGVLAAPAILIEHTQILHWFSRSARYTFRYCIVALAVPDIHLDIRFGQAGDFIKELIEGGRASICTSLQSIDVV